MGCGNWDTESRHQFKPGAGITPEMMTPEMKTPAC